MKENKYDQVDFFHKYSQMNRSLNGLEESGEWEDFQRLLPDFTQQTVLDLGCGYGWHCRYAVDQGAAQVIGVDLSEKMLEIAKEKTQSPKIEYVHTAIEEVNFPAGTFDIILSSLAFHYIANYEALVKRINQFLKADGKLIFTVEHPVFTASGRQDWIYNDKGERLYFPIDHYFNEGNRQVEFLGEKMTKYHRTLMTYVNELLINGFSIEAICEPKPPRHMMDIQGMADELRRPMMLIISASKNK